MPDTDTADTPADYRTSLVERSVHLLDEHLVKIQCLAPLEAFLVTECSKDGVPFKS